MYFVNAGLMAVLAGSPFVTVAASAPAQADRPTLVVAAPWGDSAAIAEKIGGQPVMTVGVPLGAEAVFNEEQLAQLRAHPDVWFLLDTGRLAALCSLS